MGICPDVYFSEYALTYLIESAKQITNKYFGGLLITIKLEKILTFHMKQANRT
jgi:hypothetical protein